MREREQEDLSTDTSEIGQGQRWENQTSFTVKTGIGPHDKTYWVPLTTRITDGLEIDKITNNN